MQPKTVIVEEFDEHDWQELYNCEEVALIEHENGIRL
jgi:hypothetical protein